MQTVRTVELMVLQKWMEQWASQMPIQYQSVQKEMTQSLFDNLKQTTNNQ